MSPLSLWLPTFLALFVATVAAAWLHALYQDRDDLRAENEQLRAENDRLAGRPCSMGALDGFDGEASRLLGYGNVLPLRGHEHDWPS